MAAGSPAPQPASASNSGARSEVSISGGSNGARPACAASSHIRYATPGPSRAARPARWAAAAWLARWVTSRVTPAALSNSARRDSPASTTTDTPSSVSEVSAMAVARTIRRRPSASRLIAARWAAGSHWPWSGSTRACGSRSARRSCVRLISPTPGRKARISPCSSRHAASTAAAMASSILSSGLAPSHLIASGCALPALSITGACCPSLASNRANRAPSMVADITTSRKSSRSTAALSIASARPRSLSRCRSCASSNSTAETPASSGSARMVATKIASVITSTRVRPERLLSSRVR